MDEEFESADDTVVRMTSELVEMLADVGFHVAGHPQMGLYPGDVEAIPQDLYVKIKDEEVLQSEDVVRLVTSGGGVLSVYLEFTIGPRAFDSRTLNSDEFEFDLDLEVNLPTKLEMLQEHVRENLDKGVPFDQIDLSGFVERKERDDDEG
jgi:hypothetical protein